MLKQQFNVYDNIYTSTVKDYSTIQQWFNQIKSSEYSGIISQARKFGKSHKMYNSLKATVPAITYNFNFKVKKENKNIIGNTGLLYIDIDDSSFDIESLDKKKIFSFYKSFGGIGYSILVQVSGLSLNNFKDSYLSICTDLGISSFIDVNAIKPTQYNVLSFDPNIYINYNSFVFSSINLNVINSNSNNQNWSPSNVIKKKEKTYTIDGNQFYKKIRFDNLDEIDIDGNYNVNWNGYAYVSCFLMMRKITSNKNNVLLSYCNNLVWLNSHLTEKGTIEVMINVNNQTCKEPVDIGQLKRIVSSIFKYKSDGTLKPIYNAKSRKIVFSKNAKLNKEEKLNIVRKELAQKKTNDSNNKLYNILEQWDFAKNGKITMNAIVSYGRMSKKTVVKYWPEFKAYVVDLNAANKEFIKSKRIQPEPLNEAVGEDNAIQIIQSGEAINNNVVFAAVQPCITPEEQKAFEDYLEIMKCFKKVA